MKRIFPIVFLLFAFIHFTMGQMASDIEEAIEPESVIFSYDSMGWYVLALCFIMLAFLMVIVGAKRLLSNSYRRKGVKEIRTIISSNPEEVFEKKLLKVLTVVKTVAINAYGRNTVACLEGEEWLVFLDSKSKKTNFLKYSETIKNSLYANGKVNEEDFQSLSNQSINWINGHSK